jgi:hypothetical protein
MGYHSQTLLIWEQGQTHPYPYAIHSNSDAEFSSMRKTLQDFTIQFYVQLLYVTPQATLPDDNEVTKASITEVETAATTNTPATTTLETIPEETELDLQESEFFVEVFDPKDQQPVQAAKEAAYYLQHEATDTTQPLEQITLHYGTQQDYYYHNSYTLSINMQQRESATIRPRSQALQTKQWVTTAKHC